MKSTYFKRQALAMAVTALFVGSVSAQAVIGGGPGVNGRVLYGDTVTLTGPLDLGSGGGVTVGTTSLSDGLVSIDDGTGQSVIIDQTGIAIATPSGTITLGASAGGGSVSASGTIQGGNLTSDGALTVSSGGAAIIGDSTVAGTLGVTGATTTAGITNTGTLVQNGTSTLNGDVTVTGATTSAGIANTGTLVQNGTSTLNGDVTVTGATTSAGITNTGALVQNGTSTLNGDVTVTGTATIGNGLIVNTAAGAGNLGNGVATVANGSAVLGVTNAAGHVNGISATTTSATMTGGTASTTWTLDNSGAVLADSANGQTFAVDSVGNASIKGNTSIGGNTAVAGTLGVTGATTTNGITNTGNIATGTLNTTGNAAIGGNAAVAGSLGVTGAATVNGNFSATSNAYLGGTAATATMTVTPTSVMVKNGAIVNMGGNRVQGVAPGVAGTDAANMNQLNSVRDGLQTQITDNSNEARRGIASIAAVAGIPGLNAGKQFSLGVGVGGFKGQSALAVGGNVRFSDDVTGKLAVGISGGQTTVSAGVGFSF